MDEYEDYPVVQPNYAQPNPIRGKSNGWTEALKLLLPAIAGSIAAKQGALGGFQQGMASGQQRIAQGRQQQMQLDQQMADRAMRLEDRDYNRQRQSRQDERAEEQFNWQRENAEATRANIATDNQRAGDMALWQQERGYQQEAQRRESELAKTLQAALAGPLKDPNFQKLVTEGDPAQMAIPLGDGSNMNVLEALRKVGHVFVDGKPFFEQPAPKAGGLAWERRPDGSEVRVPDAPGIKRAPAPKAPPTPKSRKTTSYTLRELDDLGTPTGKQIRITEDAETGEEISRRVVGEPATVGAPTQPAVGAKPAAVGTVKAPKKIGRFTVEIE